MHRIDRASTRLFASVAFVLAGACSGATPAPATTPPPTVDGTPARTRDNPLTVTGHGQVGATLEVRGGVDPVTSASVGADGSFSVEVMLHADAANTLTISQTVGGTESSAVMRTVTQDATPPTTPVLESIPTPTRRPMIHVRGRTEAGASIAVTGGMAMATGTADTLGHFDVTVALETSATVPVPNTLSVVATDDVGNATAPVSVSLVFDPTLAVEAPLVDPLAPTNHAAITVTGDAEPSVNLTIAGGVSSASGISDADGRFSIPVMLNVNATNTLSVFAVSGGITSTATVLVVVEDEIAPDAPTLDPQASPTSLDTVVLTGHAEAGATIAVEGGTGAASATVDASGAFSVSVDLTMGASNALAVTATDAATNTSAPVMLTIVHDPTLEAPITIDPTASPTPTNPVHLTGRATASAMVQIVGGVSEVDVVADASGIFAADVMLHANASNELHAHRAGSGADTIVVIVHDDMAPSAPTVSSIASPTAATSVLVSGMTEPLVHVSVTGGASAVTGDADGTGAFALTVALPTDATSTLAVVATDRAGNSSPATTLVVTQSTSTPPAPVLDQPAPPPTASATYHLTGHVTTPGAGITVTVTGGASTATGTADATTGVFAIDVALSPNATNMLDVSSMQGTLTSSTARVVIVHDDTPPAAPVAGSITASTPALTTCLTRRSTTITGAAGAVEARSTVRIVSVSTSATATITASDTGTFSTSLSLCPGDVLHVTATDAAGNVSTTTNVTAS